MNGVEDFSTGSYGFPVLWIDWLSYLGPLSQGGTAICRRYCRRYVTLSSVVTAKRAERIVRQLVVASMLTVWL